VNSKNSTWIIDTVHPIIWLWIMVS
jgi:hypothetical protein